MNSTGTNKDPKRLVLTDFHVTVNSLHRRVFVVSFVCLCVCVCVCVRKNVLYKRWRGNNSIRRIGDPHLAKMGSRITFLMNEVEDGFTCQFTIINNNYKNRKIFIIIDCNLFGSKDKWLNWVAIENNIL